MNTSEEQAFAAMRAAAEQVPQIEGLLPLLARYQQAREELGRANLPEADRLAAQARMREGEKVMRIMASRSFSILGDLVPWMRSDRSRLMGDDGVQRCPLCLGELPAHTESCIGARAFKLFGVTLPPAPTPGAAGRRAEYIAWYQGADTGASSETIWSAMTGFPVKRAATPTDCADFARCHRLLKRFPEWLPRLAELPARLAAWAPYVREWERMTALYERDHAAGVSHELFRLMKELQAEKVP